ncbi:CbiQ family ECF transporter T component, partial [Corynebacterium striatum]
VLPIIVAEAKAIRDAMVLRGLQPGVKSWITQPTQSSAMLIIPLLGAVVRAGDELAASALVRGLGGPTRPTTTADLSFKLVDATALAGLGLIVASVWLPTEVHL